ncbi:SdpI family protein [Agrococcus jejuensis]|uniref:Uncharacterized protein n=1 Tax=Agrococcus jejuensis TaxID=399736 RepID=A0A1G8CVQ5_9MICO|nr:hypothetical protein [Agrococcus jejuensis]SDH49571.1 hypothetical protein SAMN04489720_1427 [Agrococcus jejuensis]
MSSLGRDGARDARDGADGDRRPRLPGEGQRPVMPPREHRVPPRWWIVGGLALIVVGVVGLAIMMATSMALPATFVVLMVLVPVGIGVVLRGIALERRAGGPPSPTTPSETPRD